MARRLGSAFPSKLREELRLRLLNPGSSSCFYSCLADDCLVNPGMVQRAFISLLPSFLSSSLLRSNDIIQRVLENDIMVIMKICLYKEAKLLTG